MNTFTRSMSLCAQRTSKTTATCAQTLLHARWSQRQNFTSASSKQVFQRSLASSSSGQSVFSVLKRQTSQSTRRRSVAVAVRSLHASAVRQHLGIDRPEPGTGIKVHFNDSKGNLIKTVEANDGDDILSIAHEYDIDLEGSSSLRPVNHLPDAYHCAASLTIFLVPQRQLGTRLFFVYLRYALIWLAGALVG
ncbi:hypothetical protein D9619_009538 [Psilocybe cf. subviscida]|uniref:Uncharacterized protein n=1 Tax=Psilocybe cf. subviscida TaxID=2480587 RepID=A0A8H5BLJ9_9AGAR|nr:hypothetical protein D9619_009538 [Psilocybe cf. subviscida]